MRPFKIASVLLLARSCIGAQANYNGYQVVRVKAADDGVAVEQLIDDLQLETWKRPMKGRQYADVVVPPHLAKQFRAKTAKMQKTVMHKDLAASIKENFEYKPYAQGAVDESFFESYHSYQDHLQFLRDLQAKYPRMSRIVTSGTSLEGRNITGIQIFGSSNKPGQKPAIVWHGTVHAREWIATLVVEYLAYSILTQSSDSVVASWLSKYDFYVFPIVNPDGFLYTQTNDRLWRKNRRQNKSLFGCAGVDVNRNWPYKWDIRGGSSPATCSDVYRGPSPGSEPETKGLARFLRKMRDGPGLKQYIDFHSYSQLFMTPYGYSCDKMAANAGELAALAQAFAQALASVYGTKFETGPVCSTIYQVAGDSVDYAYDVGKSKYVFTAELRDTGENGFVLPASEIKPSCVEVWAGMKALLVKMG